MMKPLIIIFLITLFAKSSFSTNHNSKRDTIYYKIDTASIPIADRMMEIGIEASFKYYAIQCTCLKYDQKPTFFYNYEKEKGEQLLTLTPIKFITLKKLINLSSEEGGDVFNNNHVIYFIELVGSHYIKYKVILLHPHKREVVY